MERRQGIKVGIENIPMDRLLELGKKIGYISGTLSITNIGLKARGFQCLVNCHQSEQGSGIILQGRGQGGPQWLSSDNIR